MGANEQSRYARETSVPLAEVVSVAAQAPTERDSPEARLVRADRALGVLRDINRTVVRVREPSALFETVCNIAVEQGGFRVAWIGLLDPTARRIDCVARAGDAGCRLGQLDVTVRGNERGHGPAVTAVRTGERAVVSDIQKESRPARWREEALRLGLASAAALPLVVSGEVRGAMSLYSAEAGFFDDSEIGLLAEMATDIAFAMEFAEQEDQRKRAEETLARTSDLLARTAEMARVGGWELDLRTGELTWSAETYRIHDVDPLTAPAVAMAQDFYDPEAKPRLEAMMGAAIENGTPWDYELPMTTARGRTVWVRGQGAAVMERGKAILLRGTLQDITQCKEAEERTRKDAARLEVLADASQVFAAADQDYQSVLERVVRKVAEALGDGCWVRLLSDDGKWLDVAALYVADPDAREPVRTLLTRERQPVDDPGIVSAVFHSGRPAFVPVITPDQLRASHPRKLWPLFERFAIHSVVAAPLQFQGRTVGVLGVTRYRSEQPAFTDEDMGLALDLAGRASLAIASAGLLARVHGELTERRRGEAELRESERRLRRFYEAGLIGVVYWTAAGEIVDANDRFLKMTGFTREDLEAGEIDWASMTPFEYRSQDARAIDELERTGVNATPFEKEYVRKDGTRLPVVVAAATLDEERENGVAFVLDITDRKRAEEKVARQADQLLRTVEGTVLAMSRIVESRDPYTAGHERRVAELATAIAAEMGMEGEDLNGLRLASLLHDLGKLAVPTEILTKPGRLSDVEFRLIRQHPVTGFDIIGEIDFGRPLAEVVLQHHERLDGSGYPRGLKGEEILPEARILAVADVVEAMSSHRPYREALGMTAALDEVSDHAGVKYDACVVEACLRVIHEQDFQFSS